MEEEDECLVGPSPAAPPGTGVDEALDYNWMENKIIMSMSIKTT